MKFSINGIKIKFSFFFFAIIVYFVIRDKQGFIPIFLLSVLIHELTHVFFMLIFGAKISEISFMPFEISIKKSTVLKPSKEVIIHLSAPIMNLILFLLFRESHPMFGAVNFLLGIINLLPIGSLDGANALSQRDA